MVRSLNYHITGIYWVDATPLSMILYDAILMEEASTSNIIYYYNSLFLSFLPRCSSLPHVGKSLHGNY